MARLTRDDWSEAALRALAAGGLAAVAVEPLATSLGTTKGSFYWRVGYLAKLLRAAGLPAALARRRAVFAYAAFLGHLQLRAAHPALVERSVGSLRRYRADVVAGLLGPDVGTG